MENGGKRDCMIQITDEMCANQEGCLLCFWHSDCEREFKEIIYSSFTVL